MVNVRIWDLPTRLFHWLLAACVIALVITGQIGGSAMVWHFPIGGPPQRVFNNWFDFVNEVRNYFGEDVPCPTSSEINLLLTDESATPQLA